MSLVYLSISIVIIVIICAIYLRNANKDSDYYYNTESLTLSRMLRIVSDDLTELVKEDTYDGLTDEELSMALKVKANTVKSLKDCIYGKEADKALVIDLIVKIIEKYAKNSEDLRDMIDFDDPHILTYYKWEIILYYYSYILGFDKEAFKEFTSDFNLLQEKYLIEDGSKPSYIITKDEIDSIYEELNIELSFEDRVKIIAIIIFSKYKGFGVIDTIRAQNINGIMAGTSGSVMSHLGNTTHRHTASVWLNISSKYVHLPFLDMRTEEELKRIVQLLGKWNNPGPLTEKRGSLVSTMYDKSRLLLVRPPIGECWAVWVRKFSPNKLPLWFTVYNKEYVNCDLIYCAVNYILKAMVNTVWTGRQGSGKTTNMKASVEAFDPRYNLRTLEMAFELYLREEYPERNIYAFVETPDHPLSQAQDAQKKSDGGITIFGEVATDEAAGYALQVGQVGSECVMITHHAKTTQDMVDGLTGSICNARKISERKPVEDQVVNVFRLNIDLDVTTRGERYYRHISEVIKVQDNVDYPEIDPTNPALSQIKIFREYAIRSTDRPNFRVVELIRFDRETKTYYTKNRPSMDLIEYMLNRIPEDYIDGFKHFLKVAFKDYLGKKEKMEELKENQIVKGVWQNVKDYY